MSDKCENCGREKGEHFNYCAFDRPTAPPADALEDASVLTQAAEYLDHQLTGPEAVIAISVMASFAAEQIAAAKAEGIEEFIRESVKTDTEIRSFEDFADLLRSAAEKMEEGK